MKKQNLKSLKLNKKSISNIQSNENTGGHEPNTWTSYWAYCPTHPVQCRSMKHTECFCQANS